MDTRAAEGIPAAPAALPRALRGSLAAGFLLSAGLIWIFDPLPMADLPQHAAQVALYRALGDPAFPFAAQYEINYFTPYLLAYMTAAFFALALPIGLAFKATLQLGLVAWIWAIWRFQRRVGGDPWFMLFGFPLFFGLSFLWGFLNYLLAVPLVLLALELSYAHGAPTAPGGEGRGRIALQLALVGVLAFFAHGAACVFGMALGGAVALLRSPSRRLGDLLRLSLPYLPAALLAIAWRALNPEEPRPSLWHPLTRRLSLHQQLLGDRNDAEAAYWGLALLLFALAAIVTALPALRGRDGRETWARRLPLLAALAYVAAMPDNVGSFYFAGARFVLFVLLFAGWWTVAGAWRKLPPIAATLALGWLLVLLLRFGGVARDLEPLRPLLDGLPPRGTLLSIRLDEDRNPFRIPFTIHQAAWYTARREGQTDFSFAFFRTSLVRYRPGRLPAIPIGFEHQPWRFDVLAIAGGYYDYWLVYAPPGASADLPPDRFRLRERTGPWWLYEFVRTP